MDTSGDIFQLTTRCSELFAKCQSIPALVKDDWIGERLADFNLWAVGIRASETGHSSLDYRVRDRPDVKRVLVGLLSSVEDTIERCLLMDIQDSPNASSPSRAPTRRRTQASDSNPWSDFSDASTDFTDFTDDSSIKIARASKPFAAEISDISTTLDQLYRVSLLIQRSGKKYRFRRADAELARLRDDQDLMSLRSHLSFMILLRQEEVHTESWTSNDYEMLANQVARASDLTPVQIRLIDANIMRRNRIRHATRHLTRRKVEVPAPEMAELQPDSPTKEDRTRDEFTPEVEGLVEEKEPGQGEVVSRGQQAVIKTKNTLEVSSPERPLTSTEIGSVFIMGTKTAKSRGTAITRITRIGSKQDYPKCPKDRSMFSCPYCGQTLSSDYSKDVSRWRGHVKQDLMPYTCVFGDCNLPLDLFESSEEWMAHTRAVHSETRWICGVCPIDDVSGEEAAEVSFKSSQEWKDHTVTAHPEAFSEIQLEDLASISERVHLPSIPCPLCLHYDPSEDEPYDHIANHLHEFALRALPWESPGTDDGYADSVDSNNGAGRQVTGSILAAATTEDDYVKTVFDRGIASLKELLAEVLAQILDVQKGGAEHVLDKHLKDLDPVVPLLREISSLDLKDSPDDQTTSPDESQSDDTIDHYTRSLLRIRESIRLLSERRDVLSEQEAQEAEESIEDECAALRKLISGKQEPPVLGDQPLKTEEALAPIQSSLSSGPEAALGDSPKTTRTSQPLLPDSAESIPEHALWQDAFEARSDLSKTQMRYFKDLTERFMDSGPKDVERCFSDLMNLYTVYTSTSKNLSKVGELASHLKDFPSKSKGKDMLFSLVSEQGLTSVMCGSIAVIVNELGKVIFFEYRAAVILEGLSAICLAVTTELSAPKPQADGEARNNFSTRLSALCAAIFRLLNHILLVMSPDQEPKELQGFVERDSPSGEDNKTISNLSGRVKDLLSNLQRELRPMTEAPATTTLSLVENEIQLRRDAYFQEQISLTRDILYSNLMKVSGSIGASGSITHETKVEIQQKWLGRFHASLADNIWKQKFEDIPKAAARVGVLNPKDIARLGASDTAPRDSQRTLKSSQTSHSEARDVSVLLNHKKLQRFLGSEASSMLLIIPGARRTPGTHVTVSSLATAKMVETIRAASATETPVYAIAFFCGMQSRSPASSTRDSRTIMVQLVSQLMFAYPGLTPSILGSCPDNIQEASDGELFRLFSRLLKRFPPESRIFCIIDSLDRSWIPEEYSTGDASVVQFLVRLAEELPSAGPIFKLLCTTSGSATGLGMYFGHEQLSMRSIRKSPHPRSGRLSNYQFNRTAAGKALAGLYG